MFLNKPTHCLAPCVCCAVSFSHIETAVSVGAHLHDLRYAIPVSKRRKSAAPPPGAVYHSTPDYQLIASSRPASRPVPRFPPDAISLRTRSVWIARRVHTYRHRLIFPKKFTLKTAQVLYDCRHWVVALLALCYGCVVLHIRNVGDRCPPSGRNHLQMWTESVFVTQIEKLWCLFPPQPSSPLRASILSCFSLESRRRLHPGYVVHLSGWTGCRCGGVLGVAPCAAVFLLFLSPDCWAVSPGKRHLVTLLVNDTCWLFCTAVLPHHPHPLLEGWIWSQSISGLMCVYI